MGNFINLTKTEIFLLRSLLIDECQKLEKELNAYNKNDLNSFMSKKELFSKYSEILSKIS